MTPRAPVQPLAIRLQQVVETYATHSIAEQAALLGVSESRIGTLRSEALQAGLVQAHARAHRRRWTAREEARLRSLLDANTPLPRIAQVLDRRVHSIQQRCSDLGISLRDARARHYTSRSVATLFCVSDKLIAQWLRAGWLHGERDGTRRARIGAPGGSKRCPAWRISQQAVAQFVQDKRAWPAYHPNVISDPAIRQLAQAARRGAGGQWEPYRAYLRRLGISDTTYRRRKREGLLPDVETTRVGQALFMWIAEDAL